MVRKTALVTAMLGAFASQTFAMGLGDIRLNSVLNQPLLAEVELLSPTPTDLVALRVALASNEAYNKAGVERAFFHTKLRFEVVSRPNGSAVIKITSREALREPYLDFLLEATWGSGQVLREYTVLVDPPALMPAPKPVMRAPVAATTTSTPTSRVTAAAPSPRTTSAPSGAINGEYSVTRSDTLWGIAAAVRPDSDVSMEQTMLGLLEVNPNAFYDQNINNLKAGYVLRVPSREEMTAVSQSEARAETRRQNALWREGRTAETKAAAAKPKEVAGTAAPETAAATATATAAADAQLKLVAPETKSTGTAASGNNVEDLRKDLALAVESVEAQRQENQDLNTRLKQLEDQLSQLHRMIELKDNQAAQLAGTAAPTTDGTDTAAAMPETATSEGEAAAPAMDATATGDAESAQMPTDTTVPDAESEIMPEAVVGSAEDLTQEEVMPESVPVPAPAPVIKQEVESIPEPIAQEGLLASLMANPMFKWAAGGGVILVALLAWLGMRRGRDDDSDFQESILAERHAKVTAAAPNYAAPVAAAASSAKASVEAPAKDAVPTDSSLFTDFAVSDMGAIHSDAEADPVAEADVYLAYGRYQQAEELIRGALGRAPQRNDLKLKLLEVLFASKNANSFDGEAEAFLASLGNPDGDEWQRVVEMGQELNPTNPLYGALGAAAAPVEAADDMDFGEEISEPDNSLDFDAGDLDSFTPTVEEAEPSIPVEEDLSFDLSGADMDDAGEGTLASSDEVATKLDLARAYIEMGDPDGARSILDEVLQEGDAAQKSEAQGLLQKMS